MLAKGGFHGDIGTREGLQGEVAYIYVRPPGPDSP